MKDGASFDQLLDIGFLSNVIAGGIKEAMRAHDCGDSLPKNLLGSAARRAAGVVLNRMLAIPKDNPELHEAIRKEYAKIFAGERENMEKRIEQLQRQRNGLLDKCMKAGIIQKR